MGATDVKQANSTSGSSQALGSRRAPGGFLACKWVRSRVSRRVKKVAGIVQDYMEQRASAVTPHACGLLVAEDEREVRDALAWALEREGFSVWLAADGLDALDLYRAHCETIDVALLDVRMPCLDGPATLASLQKLTPEIACCFMSGDLGNYSDAGLRTQGAQAVVRKPLSVPQVAQLLRDAIAVSRLARGREAVGRLSGSRL